MRRSPTRVLPSGACALAVALTMLAPRVAGGGAAAQVSGGTATDAALGPYAALARSPAATTLLASARAAMARHWDVPREREGGPTVAAPETAQPIAWPAAPVAVYVSLVHGHATRACVGREGTSFATLSEAVEGLAVEALAADPRQSAIRREELAGLRLLITFAGQGEPIADPMLAEPGREGFSISTTRGVVAFLPGEARTVAWALREARRIGVLLGPASGASYRRFPVVVVSEPEARASTREALDGTR